MFDIARKKPYHSLRILTLDGCAFQGLSTLLILEKLLDFVTEAKGYRPKPASLFDTIAGVGSGGWLALLLGRLHLDIKPCIEEWTRLITVLGAADKESRGAGSLLKPHRTINIDTLGVHVMDLVEKYHTHDSFVTPRLPLVFLAAEDSATVFKCPGPQPGGSQECRDSDRRYGAIRSYLVDDPSKHLQEPIKPMDVRVCDAFCFTNSTRHLMAPWTETMTSNRHAKFQNDLCSHSQDIMTLAFDEMLKFHGPKTAVDLVVSISTGAPSPADVKALQEQSKRHWPFHRIRKQGSEHSDDDAPLATLVASTAKLSTGLVAPCAADVVGRTEGSTPSSRPDTSETAKKLLKNTHIPHVEPRIFNFGPAHALEGTLIDEIAEVDRVKASTKAYLEQPQVLESLKQLSRLLAVPRLR